jgi:hypothetical protein
MEGSLAVFLSIWPLAAERGHFSGPCATALVGTFTSAAIPLQAGGMTISTAKSSAVEGVMSRLT